LQVRASNIVSDDTIVALLQSRNTMDRGFRMLMDMYKERLYWHIRRMVLRHEDADDVLQNTFIKIYRGVDKFEGKSKLLTWMYRIATNETLTFLQKERARSTGGLEDAGVLKFEADTHFDGDNLQLKLHKAIAELPEKQRIVFNMRYFEETPYEEMSSMLETSVGALKASYHHAVKKIEKYFETIE
jgi:RNA polymerase sigma-70 factor (ECF subfamily)